MFAACLYVCHTLFELQNSRSRRGANGSHAGPDLYEKSSVTYKVRHKVIWLYLRQ